MPRARGPGDVLDCRKNEKGASLESTEYSDIINLNIFTILTQGGAMKLDYSISFAEQYKLNPQDPKDAFAIFEYRQ